MGIVGIILQIILGVFFTPEGVIKWTHIGPSTARFTHFRYPQWFRHMTGIVELLAGVGLLIGLWLPGLAALAALLLVVEMIVAIFSHLFRGKDPFVPDAVPAVVVLVMAFVVLLLHLGSLISLI